MAELGKSPEPLQIIGERYRVECCIASGVESSLVGAIDCATGKRVALKCWGGPTSEQEVAALQCFVRAANVTGLFENPHVVEVYGTELGDTVSYAVTEWLEGSTLAREVERVGRLPVRDALRHVLPCMRAVIEAHAVGIIHGDIRPAHIFLCRAKRHMPERARIFDFGRGAPGFHELRLPTRVVVDELCRYTPPELLCGAALDARSDIYAFGVLLYEVITGERVFVADDLFDLLREIERGPKRASADVTQALPRGLSEVLYRAMSVRPEDRFQELASFLDALLPFAVRSESSTSPIGVVSRIAERTNIATAWPALSMGLRGRRLPRLWSGAALVTTVLGLSYLAFDDGPSGAPNQSDNSTRHVTAHNAAVDAAPESQPRRAAVVKSTASEPAHDLIIPEPLRVSGSARVADQHTHVSTRRSRARPSSVVRRRERAAEDAAASMLEARAAEPAPDALHSPAAPKTQSATPLERMQLQ